MGILDIFRRKDPRDYSKPLPEIKFPPRDKNGRFIDDREQIREEKERVAKNPKPAKEQPRNERSVKDKSKSRDKGPQCNEKGQSAKEKKGKR